MKTFILCSLVFLLALRTAHADPVDVTQFGKIPDVAEREKIIETAPAGQQAELRRIDLHLRVLHTHGGEGGLRNAKERELIRLRGLVDLEDLFSEVSSMWEYHRSNIILRDEKAGVPQNVTAEKERKLLVPENAARARWGVAHSLLYRLAPTAEALRLDAQAKTIYEGIREKHPFDGSNRPVSEEEVRALDRQVDQLLEEMRKLPQLSPQAVQKAYDDLPDEAMQSQTPSWG